jgi:thioredoxin reductase (NADPH)
MKNEPVMIIGAGPAGLATAIQLKRYGIHPRLFEGAEVGGLLRNANLVENYPGFPKGVSGNKLVHSFSRQAQNLHIDVTHEEVLELGYDQNLFQARTAQNTYLSRVAVIATGTKACRLKTLTIPEELTGRVFYEVCDLLPLEGKYVAIIGSGDAAFDYALNLGRKNRVLILNRGDKPKCLPLLWERARNVSAITYKNDIEVRKLRVEPAGGMIMDCQSREGELQFHADYLVGAIGREPQLDYLSETFLQQAQALGEEGVLYQIGDVKNGIYRQTSIAVGEGVLTAMKICRSQEKPA